MTCGYKNLYQVEIQVHSCQVIVHKDGGGIWKLLGMMKYRPGRNRQLLRLSSVVKDLRFRLVLPRQPNAVKPDELVKV